MISVISKLNRLTLAGTQVFRRNIVTSTPLLFRTTPLLLAEPLKKKKRLDPAIVRAREDRRKRKIEKQIRRLERVARQLKPIDECEIPLHLMDSLKSRQRPLVTLTPEEQEGRILLRKDWARYKNQQHIADIQMLDRILFSQQKALDELKKESEELYQEAIQIDCSLLPFTAEGPSDTPSIENYEAPDGDYQDVSKKWS